MRSKLFLLSLCINGLVLFAASASRSAPLEAYGQLPSLENLTISPDGSELAYVTDAAGERTVVIFSINSSKVVETLGAGEEKVRDLRWADNDRLLITTSRTALMGGLVGPKREYVFTQAFSVSSRQSQFLLTGKTNSLDVVEGVPESRNVSGHTVVFVHGIHFPSNIGVLALFAVDLDTGRTKLIEPGLESSAGWWVDQNGNVIASTDYNNDKKLWSVSVKRNGEWTKVLEVTAPIDIPEVEGIGRDGKSLVLRMFEDKGYVRKTLSLDTGSLENSQGPDADLSAPVQDPSNHRIIGEELEGAHMSYVFYAQDDQLSWNSVAHAFDGENVELIGWSADRKKVVVHVDGTRDGSVFELVDLNTNMAQVLGRAYSGIHAPDVAEVTFLTYPAADGTNIPAYLTLPNGHAPKGLPLIVLPHGGPMARDKPGFDWWAQAMASRGYAVLQPQFRGSGGFGWDHTAAGFGQWGRKMQTDLSDGVRYLAAKGTIDPKRVCIVGASYGGYAAVAGPTLDSGVYRCAVAVAGISDPRAFLKWIERHSFESDNYAMRFWTRFMGVVDNDDPKLSEISPLEHVTNADVPILLIHGSDDTVVPIAQSRDLESALRASRKPVTFVELNSEDHWLSRSETREKMLQATVSFLETNNPPN